jgi:hypothetical protein
MNCENCKYPTLCKVTIIGSIITVISSVGWLYYKVKSTKPSSEEQKPSEEENKPDVNM